MEVRHQDGLSQTSEIETANLALFFQKCCDLLLASGYFRVRISSLTPFDKVVGGLSWCIASSGVELDIDVLFNEDATIGAKIRLCERLVEAMRAMGCPHPLQAHQIQGHDWEKVYPVLQWLVKRFFENREETVAHLRR